MSFVFVFGPCAVCDRIFSYHPDRVPKANGQPICERCMWQANTKRQALGLPELPIPPYAYDAPEMDW